MGALPTCPGVSQPWPQSTWETPALPCHVTPTHSSSLESPQGLSENWIIQL